MKIKVNVVLLLQIAKKVRYREVTLILVQH